MFIRCVSDSVMYLYAFVMINFRLLNLMILYFGLAYQKVVSKYVYCLVILLVFFV
ncbi:hypothetical protein Hanom_Chr16g01510541 [Helianthus anomalus]